MSHRRHSLMLFATAARTGPFIVALPSRCAQRNAFADTPSQRIIIDQCPGPTSFRQLKSRLMS